MGGWVYEALAMNGYVCGQGHLQINLATFRCRSTLCVLRSPSFKACNITGATCTLAFVRASLRTAILVQLCTSVNAIIYSITLPQQVCRQWRHYVHAMCDTLSPWWINHGCQLHLTFPNLKHVDLSPGNLQQLATWRYRF